MQVMGKKPIGTVAYMGGVMAVPEAFCWSFAQMVQYNTEYLCNPGEIVHYERATVSYHSYARNNICERVRGDWVLMLDCDHTFDPDILARMVNQMNTHNIDVLTAMYQYKKHPHNPVLYSWDKEDKNLELIGKWDESARLFEIGSAGGGTLLIKKSVINRIKRELGENPFDIIHPYSEDNSFFKRLKTLGIKAYCDPNIISNHLLVKELSMEDYDTSELTFSEKTNVEGRI